MQSLSWLLAVAGPEMPLHPMETAKPFGLSLLYDTCTLRLPDWSAPRALSAQPPLQPLRAPVRRPASVRSTSPAAHRRPRDTASFAAHPLPSAPGRPVRSVSK